MVKPHELHAYFDMVDKEIAAHYRRIRVRAAEDPGTAGDDAESVWERVIADWIPSTYHVVRRGRVINAKGETSPQIDILVLKPTYPRALLGGSLYLADGVVGVFECKLTLRSSHIRDSVRRAADFKSLVADTPGTPLSDLVSPIYYGILSHSHEWQGAKSSPERNVFDTYSGAESSIDHPRHLIDLICVADLATWSRMTITKFSAATELDSIRNKMVIGSDWKVASGLMHASSGSQDHSEHFRPVGAAIQHFVRRLGYRDASVRYLADHYRGSGISGAGAGRLKYWDKYVYSERTLQQIDARYIDGRNPWNEWGLVFS